jgi:hypothetical protein
MKRIVVALVACLTLATFVTFAASASAATAKEKLVIFNDCMKWSASLMRGNPNVGEACCTKAGGTWTTTKDGAGACVLIDDFVGVPNSIQPPVVIIIKP